MSLIKKISLDGQVLAEAKFFDAENRKNVFALVEQGKLTEYVAGFQSYFSDDEVSRCSVCGAEVSIRPWAKQVIEKHKLKLLCVNCASKSCNVQKEAVEYFDELIRKIIKLS